jgi:hypothetical protein
MTIRYSACGAASVIKIRLAEGETAILLKKQIPILRKPSADAPKLH